MSSGAFAYPPPRQRRLGYPSPALRPVAGPGGKLGLSLLLAGNCVSPPVSIGESVIRANCRMPPRHGAAKWLRKAGTAGNRDDGAAIAVGPDRRNRHAGEQQREEEQAHGPQDRLIDARSEEHTSELQ